MAVQTGKFHVYEIKDDKRVVSAIANATLYFLDVNNQEQFKLIAKTDNDGNFNFDLALGEYIVLATAGDGLEQVLANGSTFKLTAQSKVSAFEEWLNKPSESIDSSLLAKFRELMQRTETAATSIQNTEAQLRTDINKKWDKQEGTNAVAKKWDIQQTVGSGKVMKEGAYGLGITGVVQLHESSPSGIYIHAGSEVIQQVPGNKSILKFGGTASRWIGITEGSGELSYMSYSGSIRVARDTQNTSVDSNGFIKRASPVVNLYANHIEHNDQFDEEPIFSKIDIGHYKISNTLGLAKGLDAGDWYIETPKDKNGERYFNTEWQQLDDNTVIIRTYEREAFTEEYERYDESGEVLKDPNGNPLKFYKIHEINGEPIDITENRFISLRFYEEPKEYEAPEIAEESEEDRKAREEQQALEARDREITELKRNRTLKSNEALVMKDIDESVYLELIEEVKEINARLKSAEYLNRKAL